MATGFYQRRNELCEAILKNNQISPAAKCVALQLLVGYMNSHSEAAWMSAGRLANDLHLSVETVRRALSRLYALGFFARERRTGRTTVYWMGYPWQHREHAGRLGYQTHGRGGRNLRR